MSKFKKIIGIVMTFVLCMLTFSSSFNFSDAVENAPKLMTRANDTLPFPVTIRDFRADYVVFEPDDTTHNGQRIWMGSGMVEDEIGTDSNGNRFPQFNQYVSDTLTAYFQANKDKIIANTKTYHKNEEKGVIHKVAKGEISEGDYVDFVLNRLFKDSNELNKRDLDAIKNITLKKNNDSGAYEYDSRYSSINRGFFAMDNLGFDRSGKETNQSHNYHFTLESHTQFWLGNEELTFNFSGDDDVWVYINDTLVIDLGGIHTRQQQSISIRRIGNTSQFGVYNTALKNDGPIITLEKENWYNFDFFYMERHTTESNLMISTNMEFKPKVDVSKNVYNSETTYNAGTPISNLQDYVAYSGETLYYSLGLTNTGNVTLNNVSFKDDKLGIFIDSTGVYKNGQKVSSGNISIIKKDKNGSSTSINNLNDLTILNTLESGANIEVKSKYFLKYTVTDEDANNGKVTNTVNGSGEYAGNGYNETADASVTVKVEKQNINASINKEVYTVNGKYVSYDNK